MLYANFDEIFAPKKHIFYKICHSNATTKANFLYVSKTYYLDLRFCRQKIEKIVISIKIVNHVSFLKRD